MPTNDERRKIAAELRENRDPLTPYNLVDYIFDDPWNHTSGEEVAARLADLIEPEPERTCRMLLDEDATSLLEYDEVFRCTACGEEVVRKTGTTIRFCPMCRARATDWVVPG